MGDRTTTNVRLTLPAVICWARVCDDLRRRQEAMEVRENEQCRAVRRGQGVERPDGSQRVRSTGVGSLPVALPGKLQAGAYVPGGQPPVLLAAHLGDFAEGIIMLVRFESRCR